jgi:hypothetical protein
LSRFGVHRYALSMSSLSNLGKVITLFAGLVAVLDPIGKERLERWAGAAQKRRDQAKDRSAELAKERTLQALVKRISVLVAIHDSPLRPKLRRTGKLEKLRPEDHEYVKPEAFRRFADEAWSAITATGEYNKADLSASDYMAVKFEHMTYRFLIEELDEPNRTRLASAYDEANQQMRRWGRVRRALLLSAIPGAIALALWFWAGGIPILIGLIVAGPSVVVAALAANALLGTPHFATAFQHSAAKAELRLAGTGLQAVKDNGKKVRIIALALFIVGSMLDLIGGWND